MIQVVLIYLLCTLTFGFLMTSFCLFNAKNEVKKAFSLNSFFDYVKLYLFTATITGPLLPIIIIVGLLFILKKELEFYFKKN